MVEGGMRCIKYLLFVFNLIFAITGIAILVIGALIEHLYKHYITFLDDKFLTTPVLLIVVGVIVFVVAFFGCCGAVKEHHCMVITFSVLLGLIFVLELAAGIAAFVLQNDVKNIMEKNMYDTLLQYGDGEQKALTAFWDDVQHTRQCCGVLNKTDWQRNLQMNKTNLPDSCCKEYSVHCGNGTAETEPESFYEQGCLKSLTNLIEDNVTYVGGVGVGIAFVQLLGIIFSCCLARAIKREYESV